MDYRELNVYKFFINGDPGLTLTHFMARSNLIKIAYCAYTRPRSQMSVNRTLGPLILFFSKTFPFDGEKMQNARNLFGVLLE